MKIDKTLEGPTGTYTFQGELTGQELEVVVQYGLNTLMALGAIRSTARVTQEKDEAGPEDSTLQ